MTKYDLNSDGNKLWEELCSNIKNDLEAWQDDALAVFGEGEVEKEAAKVLVGIVNYQIVHAVNSFVPYMNVRNSHSLYVTGARNNDYGNWYSHLHVLDPEGNLFSHIVNLQKEKSAGGSGDYLSPGSAERRFQIDLGELEKTQHRQHSYFPQKGMGHIQALLEQIPNYVEWNIEEHFKDFYSARGDIRQLIDKATTEIIEKVQAELQDYISVVVDKFHAGLDQKVYDVHCHVVSSEHPLPASVYFYLKHPDPLVEERRAAALKQFPFLQSDIHEQDSNPNIAVISETMWPGVSKAIDLGIDPAVAIAESLGDKNFTGLVRRLAGMPPYIAPLIYSNKASIYDWSARDIIESICNICSTLQVDPAKIISQEFSTPYYEIKRAANTREFGKIPNALNEQHQLNPEFIAMLRCINIYEGAAQNISTDYQLPDEYNPFAPRGHKAINCDIIHPAILEFTTADLLKKSKGSWQENLDQILQANPARYPVFDESRSIMGNTIDDDVENPFFSCFNETVLLARKLILPQFAIYLAGYFQTPQGGGMSEADACISAEDLIMSNNAFERLIPVFQHHLITRIYPGFIKALPNSMKDNPLVGFENCINKLHEHIDKVLEDFGPVQNIGRDDSKLNVKPTVWPGVINGAYIDPETGLTVVEMVNQSQLNEEHAKMNHCIQTYASKCWNDGSHVFSIRTPDGESLSTFEMSERFILTGQNPRTYKWSLGLVQHKGPNNEVINDSKILRTLDNFVANIRGDDHGSTLTENIKAARMKRGQDESQVISGKDIKSICGYDWQFSDTSDQIYSVIRPSLGAMFIGKGGLQDFLDKAGFSQLFANLARAGGLNVPEVTTNAVSLFAGARQLAA